MLRLSNEVYSGQVANAARNILSVVLVVVFVGLGLLHLYWSLGGRSGRSAAVPSLNGEPL
jgi:hypothetical protein